MFRPAGSIYFKTKDGEETVAATASTGLLLWYMTSSNKSDQTSESTAILEVTPTTIVGPYDQRFLIEVIGCIERTYGTAPEIPAEFLSIDWYNCLPPVFSDHKMVVQRYRDGEPQIVAYEEFCLTILKWIAEHGDIDLSL